MQFKCVVEVKLLIFWGDFLMVGFEELVIGQDYVVLVYGDILGQLLVFVCVYLECLMGDVLFSLCCDCGFQLEVVLLYIVEEGWGILFYYCQEGCNIGLLNKICVYVLQDQGYDIVEVNYQFGFVVDECDFILCVDMFKLFNVEQVWLLINNLKKVEIFIEVGINIVEWVLLIVGCNLKNVYYLDIKVVKMGYLLNSKLIE